MIRKMSLLIGALAAAATHRMVGTTPVATFTLAGTITEINQEGQPVAVPFVQTCEAWGPDALRVLDMTPGTLLTVSGKPELNAYPVKSRTQDAAPATPPRPGQATAHTAGTGPTVMKKEIRVRADFVERAYIDADTVTETNGSIRSLFGVNRTQVVGRLVQDVRVVDTKGGMLVFGTVAVEERVRKGGEWTKHTEFFDFKIWRDAAAMVASGVKGQMITLLDGMLLVDRRTDENNVVTRNPVIQAGHAFLAVKPAAKTAAHAADQTADTAAAPADGTGEGQPTQVPDQVPGTATTEVAQPAPF